MSTCSCIQIESQLRRANRALRTLSSCHKVLVRAEAAPELLEAICHIIVEHGGYRLAWVGIAEDDDARSVRPVAHAGYEAGYLETLNITWADTARGRGPTGTAIRTGRPVVCHNFLTDPQMALWRADAVRRGYAASLVLPLRDGPSVFGAVTVYAAEPDSFDDEEIALLSELADDLAYGMKALATRADHRRAEQALAASEERLRSATVHSPIGMAIVALDGRWLEVNPALCAIAGYTREELLATTFQAITHPDDIASDLEHVRRMLARELDTYQIQKRYLHRCGHVVWIQLNVSLVWNADGTPRYFISQIQDITERRRMEEQFRQAQKMEAIGQLAGGVAHDFNNIVGAILLQAEMAGSSPDIPGEVRELLGEIVDSAHRAASLTRQLLAFSRRQVLQPRLLNMNEIVTNLAKMLRRILGEDVRMQLSLHPAPLMIYADAGMLDQVLMNLAVNGRDSMPSGGHLIVETRMTVLTEEEARAFPDALPGPHACLAVTDTGTGIPPEHLPRIFEPFFTTKEQGKGTGLGLATVFGIVRQHHGAIQVASTVGLGTTVRVCLPALPVAPDGSLTHDLDGQPRGGDETILLVEDDPAVRHVTRAVLGRFGYEVVEARTGAEALQRWEQRGGQVDVLVTDMVLPEGMSGRELASLLQARAPQVRVIFTSGYSPEIAGRELRLEEGQNFLPKPYQMHQMLTAIRRSLESTSAP